MSVFQRGRFWWYEFEFRGQRFRVSTSSTSKEVAKRAERARRLQLEEGIHQLKAVKRPMVFSGVAKQWLEAKAPQWSKSNLRIESYNVGHLVETFGKLLLTDITPDGISKYQATREKQGASKRTINMAVGTIRAILRKHRLWSNLQPDVKMLRTRSDIGRALAGHYPRTRHTGVCYGTQFQMRLSKAEWRICQRRESDRLLMEQRFRLRRVRVLE